MSQAKLKAALCHFVKLVHCVNWQLLPVRKLVLDSVQHFLLTQSQDVKTPVHFTYKCAST